MLTRHVMMCGTARKSEQRRDALLARLKIDSDQLMGEYREGITQVHEDIHFIDEDSRR